MTREIKFRAWDKENNVMYNTDVLNINEAIEMSEEGLWELMQFTGLLDKNGKEIYEGDIITAVFDDGYYERIGYTGEPKCKGLIKWDYCGFMMKLLEDDKRYLQELVFMEDKEVIGNIYENKELLND